MNFIQMTYKRIVESDDLKSYDNWGLTIFITFGIIGHLLRAFRFGQLIDATNMEIAEVLIKSILVGLISYFSLYYLNGAVTSFVSSKLGEVASNAETRIGYAIGLFPFLVFNIALLALHIILLGIWYLTPNSALTLINHGPNFKSIQHLRNACTFIITVGLTSSLLEELTNLDL